MVFWIKRIATILGFTAFFGIMLLNLAYAEDPFEPVWIISALLKASLGAALFWFAGFIVGDIFLKGVLTDIEFEKNHLLEGGILQQIQTKQKEFLPGGPELPFADDEGQTEGQEKVTKRK